MKVQSAAIAGSECADLRGSDGRELIEISGALMLIIVADGFSGSSGEGSFAVGFVGDN